MIEPFEIIIDENNDDIVAETVLVQVNVEAETILVDQEVVQMSVESNVTTKADVLNYFLTNILLIIQLFNVKAQIAYGRSGSVFQLFKKQNY